MNLNPAWYDGMMDVVLRPARWMYLATTGLIVMAGSIYFFTAAPLIFIAVLVCMAGLILLGCRTKMTLDEKSIAQSGNLFGRYNWKFFADEIESWSEIGVGEAQWLAMAPEDREVMGGPASAGWQERLNRNFLFRLTDSGEIIQINPVFSWGKNQEVVRRWLIANIGRPLQGDNQLHWFIEKKRDKRCYLQRAIPDTATIAGADVPRSIRP